MNLAGLWRGYFQVATSRVQAATPYRIESAGREGRTSSDPFSISILLPYQESRRPACPCVLRPIFSEVGGRRDGLC